MSFMSQNETSFAGSPDPAEHPLNLGSRDLPPVWRPLARWFTSYSRQYMGKHFNSLRISRLSPIPNANRMPIVLYANHAGWWDPLVGLILTAEFFSNYTLFAPIEAVALRQYKILSKVGFFGVERQSRRGVFEFFKTAETILRNSNHLLAVTPQGRFADARERPTKFQRGLGLLATRVQCALFIPLAIEYSFWDQRLPEALCRFGAPSEVRADHSVGSTAWDWSSIFERNLETTQDALAKEVCRRDPGNFRDLLSHRKKRDRIDQKKQAVA